MILLRFKCAEPLSLDRAVSTIRNPTYGGKGFGNRAKHQINAKDILYSVDNLIAIRIHIYLYITSKHQTLQMAPDHHLRYIVPTASLVAESLVPSCHLQPVVVVVIAGPVVVVVVVMVEVLLV